MIGSTMYLKLCLFIIAIAANIGSYSQSNKQALKLYNNAVKALRMNEYQKALDLLNESIAIRNTSDSYVNRALCKLKLGDHDGYCEDLRMAYLLIDKSAYVSYWKDCGKIDTSFVDSIGRKCNRSDSEYKRVIRTPFNMTYDQEMELFYRSGQSALSATINDGDTLYHEGTLINAPIWIDKDAWMESLVNELDHYLDNFQIHMNVYANGTLGELTISGLTKEGEYRVMQYVKRNPPEIEPATLWGKPIHLRINQKVKAS